ncbi:hypothetical protein AAFF_G00221050 [Aldrovandia affinis]|uniref:Uncharacterized protein n=1 Tax=Aldrovandia affinis TaxID=143900 RepID=A0AAD7RFV6_9TELE|nr:hypothetical protein AAFF_G00221050 [Aldrovandia affinis]
MLTVPTVPHRGPRVAGTAHSLPGEIQSRTTETLHHAYPRNWSGGQSHDCNPSPRRRLQHSPFLKDPTPSSDKRGRSALGVKVVEPLFRSGVGCWGHRVMFHLPQ